MCKEVLWEHTKPVVDPPQEVPAVRGLRGAEDDRYQNTAQHLEDRCREFDPFYQTQNWFSILTILPDLLLPSPSLKTSLLSLLKEISVGALVKSAAGWIGSAFSLTNLHLPTTAKVKENATLVRKKIFFPLRTVCIHES